MKKLRLTIENLAVETFETGRAVSAGGTVHAAEAQPTIKIVCDQTLLATNPTCCPCTPMY